MDRNTPASARDMGSSPAHRKDPHAKELLKPICHNYGDQEPRSHGDKKPGNHI